ncbi:hypothetical protein PENCOP_c001G05952 [Penicillium coprophilum]|uniref:Profilin n=1 Tax=Penicillium coprophilum TaxID=36646 RepID=A0A1V6V5X5_9EURO|nr:hypothetical protein PENCOP_c001G05952 [Penicillium coprophilum]
MSWQDYVDTILVGSGHIDKAAIISAAGDSIWAASPDFQLKPEEMKDCALLASGDSSAKDKAIKSGLRIGGMFYFILHIADDGLILAKFGNSGVAVAKGKQAVIIGHHDERQNPSEAVSVVARLADFLKYKDF